MRRHFGLYRENCGYGMRSASDNTGSLKRSIHAHQVNGFRRVGEVKGWSQAAALTYTDDFNVSNVVQQQGSFPWLDDNLKSASWDGMGIAPTPISLSQPIRDAKEGPSESLRFQSGLLVNGHETPQLDLSLLVWCIGKGSYVAVGAGDLPNQTILGGCFTETCNSEEVDCCATYIPTTYSLCHNLLKAPWSISLTSHVLHDDK